VFVVLWAASTAAAVTPAPAFFLAVFSYRFLFPLSVVDVLVVVVINEESVRLELLR
jgi:hypothetical protein